MRSKLIEFRKNLGMTQAEFGGMFGKRRCEWCSVERGNTKGSVDMWVSLAEKFNLSVEELKNLMEDK